VNASQRNVQDAVLAEDLYYFGAAGSIDICIYNLM